MTFAKWAIAALLFTGAGLVPRPAQALIAIPIGVADGPARDLITISGVYATPLPDPLAPPFSATNFALTLTIPAKVIVDASGPDKSEFSIPVSGSYTDGGVTTVFTNQNAFFGALNTGLPTFANNFSLQVAGFLQPNDFFQLGFQASAPLFGPTTFMTGVDETFTVGDLDVSNASANYATDPPFTGTVSITPTSPAPEPAAWAMMLAGLAGLGAVARARRRQGAYFGVVVSDFR